MSLLCLLYFDARGVPKEEAEDRGRKSEIRGQRSGVRDQRAAGSWQQAVSLSVISYLLFGRSVAMSCLDDLNDFYDFYDLTI